MGGGPTTIEDVAELMQNNLPGIAMNSADFIDI